MKKFTLLPVSILIFILTCTTQTLRDQTFTGLHQSEIKEMLGEKLVTWIYKDNEGRVELYFLNDSTEVADEFYWYDDESKNPVF